MWPAQKCQQKGDFWCCVGFLIVAKKLICYPIISWNFWFQTGKLSISSVTTSVLQPAKFCYLLSLPSIVTERIDFCFYATFIHEVLDSTVSGKVLYSSAFNHAIVYYGCRSITNQSVAWTTPMNDMAHLHRQSSRTCANIFILLSQSYGAVYVLDLAHTILFWSLTTRWAMSVHKTHVNPEVPLEHAPSHCKCTK